MLTQSARWPWPNCAVITLRQIVNGAEPILHVSHNSDDQGWQFQRAGDACEEDAAVVLLRGIVDLDPSVLQVADMPPGWHAWRASVEQEWVRRINPNDALKDREPGDGFLRTEGALADDTEWDDIMDEIQQARRQQRRPQTEEDR